MPVVYGGEGAGEKDKTGSTWVRVQPKEVVSRISSSTSQTVVDQGTNAELNTASGPGDVEQSRTSHTDVSQASTTTTVKTSSSKTAINSASRRERNKHQYAEASSHIKWYDNAHQHQHPGSHSAVGGQQQKGTTEDYDASGALQVVLANQKSVSGTSDVAASSSSSGRAGADTNSGTSPGSGFTASHVVTLGLSGEQLSTASLAMTKESSSSSPVDDAAEKLVEYYLIAYTYFCLEVIAGVGLLLLLYKFLGQAFFIHRVLPKVVSGGEGAVFLHTGREDDGVRSGEEEMAPMVEEETAAVGKISSKRNSSVRDSTTNHDQELELVEEPVLEVLDEITGEPRIVHSSAASRLSSSMTRRTSSINELAGTPQETTTGRGTTEDSSPLAGATRHSSSPSRTPSQGRDRRSNSSTPSFQQLQQAELNSTKQLVKHFLYLLIFQVFLFATETGILDMWLILHLDPQFSVALLPMLKELESKEKELATSVMDDLRNKKFDYGSGAGLATAAVLNAHLAAPAATGAQGNKLAGTTSSASGSSTIKSAEEELPSGAGEMLAEKKSEDANGGHTGAGTNQTAAHSTASVSGASVSTKKPSNRNIVSTLTGDDWIKLHFLRAMSRHSGWMPQTESSDLTAIRQIVEDLRTKEEDDGGEDDDTSIITPADFEISKKSYRKKKHDSSSSSSKRTSKSGLHTMNKQRPKDRTSFSDLYEFIPYKRPRVNLCVALNGFDLPQFLAFLQEAEHFFPLHNDLAVVIEVDLTKVLEHLLVKVVSENQAGEDHVPPRRSLQEQPGGVVDVQTAEQAQTVVTHTIAPAGGLAAGAATAVAAALPASAGSSTFVEKGSSTAVQHAAAGSQLGSKASPADKVLASEAEEEEVRKVGAAAEQEHGQPTTVAAATAATTVTPSTATAVPVPPPAVPVVSPPVRSKRKKTLVDAFLQETSNNVAEEDHAGPAGAALSQDNKFTVLFNDQKLQVMKKAIREAGCKIILSKSDNLSGCHVFFIDPTEYQAFSRGIRERKTNGARGSGVLGVHRDLVAFFFRSLFHIPTPAQQQQDATSQNQFRSARYNGSKVHQHNSDPLPEVFPNRNTDVTLLYEAVKEWNPQFYVELTPRIFFRHLLFNAKDHDQKNTFWEQVIKTHVLSNSANNQHHFMTSVDGKEQFRFQLASFVNFNPDTPKNLAGKLLINTTGTRLVRLLWLLTNNFFYQKPWHLKQFLKSKNAAEDLGLVSSFEKNMEEKNVLHLTSNYKNFYTGLPQKEYAVYLWTESMLDRGKPSPPNAIGISEQWKTNPLVASFQDDNPTETLLEHVGHFSSLEKKIQLLHDTRAGLAAWNKEHFDSFPEMEHEIHVKMPEKGSMSVDNSKAFARIGVPVGEKGWSLEMNFFNNKRWPGLEQMSSKAWPVQYMEFTTVAKKFEEWFLEVNCVRSKELVEKIKAELARYVRMRRRSGKENRSGSTSLSSSSSSAAASAKPGLSPPNSKPEPKGTKPGPAPPKPPPANSAVVPTEEQIHYFDRLSAPELQELLTHGVALSMKKSYKLRGGHQVFWSNPFRDKLCESIRIQFFCRSWRDFAFEKIYLRSRPLPVLVPMFQTPSIISSPLIVAP
eukprot:GSA120T00007063001.1